MHINIKDIEKTINAETAFLKKEGWSKIDDENNVNSFVSPDGREYKWLNALDKAVQTCIYRDGWFPVVVHTTHPKSRLKDDEFCYYAHEKYNRLFFFGDLSDCYINNIDPDGVVSLIAKSYSEVPSLKDLKYVEGMWIKVDMWIEYPEPDKHSKACYKLVEIGDWRERDKNGNRD